MNILVSTRHYNINQLLININVSLGFSWLYQENKECTGHVVCPHIVIFDHKSKVNFYSFSMKFITMGNKKPILPITFANFNEMIYGNY